MVQEIGCQPRCLLARPGRCGGKREPKPLPQSIKIKSQCEDWRAVLLILEACHAVLAVKDGAQKAPPLSRSSILDRCARRGGKRRAIPPETRTKSHD